MMKIFSGTLALSILFFVMTNQAWSLPTTCGETGLLNQPTAQTLNSGNICVGLWGDYSEWGQTPSTEFDATVMPFAITLGLGSFMEAYGSFPNLLFNDEETASGRGFAILGTKLRLLGDRSSLLKFAIGAQFRRAVSADPDIDGLTDFLGRGIVSLKTNRFGLHGWGGILDKEENLPAGIGPFEDITGYGGGIEFFPSSRLRIMAEVETFTETVLNTDDTGEWMAGIQYFLSPHLTLSLGYGEGLTDLSPESRILVGLSTCQGIGTYSQIERKELAPVEPEVEEKMKEPVKMLKIKTLSPLLGKTKPVETAPATPQELPEGPDAGETVAAPAIPVVSMPQFLEAEPASTAVEVAVGETEEIVLEPAQNITKSNRFAKTIDKQPVSAVGSPGFSDKDKAVVSTPTRTKVYRRFLLPEFAFEVDQSTLTPEGSAALSMIAVELSRDDKWFAMRIDGHTDSTGSEQYNNELSFSRAVEYAMHLVAKNGVDPSRVFVKGFGEGNPIADNGTAEGRKQNRRVELMVLVSAE